MTIVNLIDHEIQKRSATVRALSETTTLSLTWHDLHDLHKERPNAFLMIVMNLAREVSRRLRRTNTLYAAVQASGQRSGV